MSKKVLTNVVRGKPGQARQGDVLVEPVHYDEVSNTWGAMYQEEVKSVVIAVGEGTGHNHVVECEDMRVIRKLNNMFLELRTVGWMIHTSDPTNPDHDPIQLAPGLYRVRRQMDSIGQRSTYVRD